MSIRSKRMACIIAVLLLAAPAWGQDYLYTPAPAGADVSPGSEGVLVREVTVKKGDSLYRLSKQFSGKGYYYPQILLFNELKNPRLIHPGSVLRVPVSAKVAAVASDADSKQPVSRKAAAPAVAKSRGGKKAAAHLPKKAEAAPKAAVVPATELNQYARAQEAVKQGDCQGAIKLLDSFISAHPNSPLLPEAALSRAECYMKLASP